MFALPSRRSRIMPLMADGTCRKEFPVKRGGPASSRVPTMKPDVRIFEGNQGPVYVEWIEDHPEAPC
jgi:hypothetical protein